MLLLDWLMGAGVARGDGCVLYEFLFVSCASIAPGHTHFFVACFQVQSPVMNVLLALM